MLTHGNTCSTDGWPIPLWDRAPYKADEKRHGPISPFWAVDPQGRTGYHMGPNAPTSRQTCVNNNCRLLFSFFLMAAAVARGPKGAIEQILPSELRMVCIVELAKRERQPQAQGKDCQKTLEPRQQKTKPARKHPENTLPSTVQSSNSPIDCKPLLIPTRVAPISGVSDRRL